MPCRRGCGSRRRSGFDVGERVEGRDLELEVLWRRLCLALFVSFMYCLVDRIAFGRPFKDDRLLASHKLVKSEGIRSPAVEVTTIWSAMA